MAASRTFVSMMFMVFLARTEPAQSMAKPSCMENTRYAEKRRYVLSMAYVAATNLFETVSKPLHMYSAAAVALAAVLRRGRRSAAEQVKPAIADAGKKDKRKWRGIR